MSEWIRVTDLAALKRRKKQVVEVEGAEGEVQEIALFYVDGDVYAMNDICIHKQRRLHKGLVFQGNVICPGHQWAFDLKTGWVDEWAKCQPVYNVKIDGQDVYVDPTPKIRTTPPQENEKCPK
ncbi:Rieske (2Fe-2S) protein [Luteithermobacter gelatinilyticus]|uniref:Rieske (2Fe-2S) protein n=1 Tax=Luteithermobacter gelatinilyticus TaxID=2582913 RepID=UPI001105DE5C|nr:Rieske 2Fe-2S domain-containing protein [Luteithermobacter gelatinilyticus]